MRRIRVSLVFGLAFEHLIFLSTMVSPGFVRLTQAQQDGTKPVNNVSSSSAATHGNEFEFATVKPVSPSSDGPVDAVVNSNGRVSLHKQSLKGLLCIAFNLRFWQIEGDSKKLTQNYYDVEAQAPLDPSKTFEVRITNGLIEDSRLREMLQALLVDRFQLKFHREAKVGAIYSLDQSGKILSLKSVPADAPTGPRPPSIALRSGAGWTLHGASMQELAQYLAYVLHKPVSDHTGLLGTFDFVSKDVPADEDFHTADVAQTLLPTLAEMGLRLKKDTGPVDVLMIDSVSDLSAN